jgi:hypothetical protein
VLTQRFIKDVHDQEVRELEMRLRPVDAAPESSGTSLRRMLGRALIQVGSGMAADCQPQMASRR